MRRHRRQKDRDTEMQRHGDEKTQQDTEGQRVSFFVALSLLFFLFISSVSLPLCVSLFSCPCFNLCLQNVALVASPPFSTSPLHALVFCFVNTVTISIRYESLLPLFPLLISSSSQVFADYLADDRGTLIRAHVIPENAPVSLPLKSSSFTVPLPSTPPAPASCIVCDTEEESLYFGGACGHRLCRGCWKEYLMLRISDSNPIPCPAYLPNRRRQRDVFILRSLFLSA